jgi:hypothetical protein
MTAVADIFTGVMYFAGGSLLSYCAGWVFMGAVEDIGRMYRFVKRFMNGE